MDDTNYLSKKNELFNRWKKNRKDYISEGKRFSEDGIICYESWYKSKPKILFLLKENWASEGDWEPCWGINTYANTFSTNIVRWYKIIKELYSDISKKISIEKIELPEKIDDIAIIEIKKVNEGKPSSSNNEIREYARNDKGFIKEQIELINPDIIFCCYTSDYYSDDIYGDEPWEELISINGSYYKNFKCFKHRNRLVIDFYHPSNWIQVEDLFNSLCRILKEGNVFSHFNW